VQCLRPNATPGGASATRAEFLTHFRWKVVRRSNYPIHAALPYKRYAWRRIYYSCRIPYSCPLEGSPEDQIILSELLFRPNATPGGASTTHTEYLTYFCWKVVRRTYYPVHALPNAPPGGVCIILAIHASQPLIRYLMLLKKASLAWCSVLLFLCVERRGDGSEWGRLPNRDRRDACGTLYNVCFLSFFL